MAHSTHVGLLFGGRSAEHEVSVRSARSVLKALQAGASGSKPYEVRSIGITKAGTWHTGERVERLLHPDTGALVVEGDGAQPALPQPGLLDGLDVIFPVLHGPYGEDGTVQGLLEMAGLPYVGAGVAASAVAMDKILFKEVMRAGGFAMVPHTTTAREGWEREPDRVLTALEAAVDYPVFVKPANLGSSIGISRCEGREELEDGLEDAGRYDRRILVEEAVPNVREIEVGVLGNGEKVEAAGPGEIVASRDFYDYEAKYLDEGEQASKLLVPAPLPDEQAEEVRAMARDVYRAIDCAGLARVDFLLNDATGELFINELNTLPGFTSISLYPRVWKAAGIAYPELVHRLIELAFERHEEQRQQAVEKVGR